MTELTTLPSGAFSMKPASYKNYEIIDMR
jgi:hypothetical protein